MLTLLRPLGIAFALALSAMLIGPAASSRADGSCGSWTLSNAPAIGVAGGLAGVAALTSSDAWAVGGFDPGTPPDDGDTLVEHWDGQQWTVVPSPNVVPPPPYLLSYDNELNGVAAVGADDVWAVGTTYDGNGHYTTLAEHWNGTQWSIVPSPNVPGFNDNELRAVSAVSSSDVWAVGLYDQGTLVEHWDGTSWSVVPSPNPSGPSDGFHSVAAVAADDAWAVGLGVGPSGGPTFIEHWNGSEWSAVDAPAPTGTTDAWLFSVSATGPDDAWAGGYWQDTTGFHPLLEHWDGSAWQVATSPDVAGTNYVAWDGLSSFSPGDAWAVGVSSSDFGTMGRTLTAHWNGRAWKIVPSQDLGSSDRLQSVSALRDGTAVAVGDTFDSPRFGNRPIAENYCPAAHPKTRNMSVSDTGFSPSTVRAQQGYTVQWTFQGPGDNRVSDATGIGLFDSGTMPAGSTYSLAFSTAGAYALADDLGHTGTVKVPVRLKHQAGGLHDSYPVQWSSEKASAGLQFDVQVLRPGAAGWGDWLTGQTGVRAGFVPDAGAGVYRFRARLRSTINGAATDWSAPKSIAVG